MFKKISQQEPTPKQAGYYFPAEFAPQEAMWLSWIHKEESWPGKIEAVYQPYCEFILTVASHQKVRINVADMTMKNFALEKLHAVAREGFSGWQNIEFFFHPTNDAWCRDHGPAFLIHSAMEAKAIVDWGYNAWGGKYPPYDLDDVIPTLIAQKLQLPVYEPGIVMEGGSVELNGEGTLLTTTACLLNKNRNPHLSQQEIEYYLREYYGVETILWLHEGIVGDDTDGHIDDIVRFVNEDTVVAAVEENRCDENYEVLKKNLALLRNMRLQNDKPLNIVELPMPSPIIYQGQRLPASYANFYISNECVVVPTFRDDKRDVKALEILQKCFSTRKVVGIDSVDLVWGLGSFHCLSQQEPRAIAK